VRRRSNTRERGRKGEKGQLIRRKTLTIFFFIFYFRPGCRKRADPSGSGFNFEYCVCSGNLCNDPEAMDEVALRDDGNSQKGADASSPPSASMAFIASFAAASSVAVSLISALSFS